jgi:hypothetical protein
MGTLGSIAKMRHIAEACLFLMWVTVYLGAVYWIGNHRRAKLGTAAGSGAQGYRADKDVGLWIAVFAVGVFLLALAYLGTQVIARSL